MSISRFEQGRYQSKRPLHGTPQPTGNFQSANIGFGRLVFGSVMIWWALQLSADRRPECFVRHLTSHSHYRLMRLKL